MAKYLLLDRRNQPAGSNHKFLVRLDSIDAVYEEAGTNKAWVMVGGASHQINIQYDALADILAEEAGVRGTD